MTRMFGLDPSSFVRGPLIRRFFLGRGWPSALAEPGADCSGPEALASSTTGSGSTAAEEDEGADWPAEFGTATASPAGGRPPLPQALAAPLREETWMMTTIASSTLLLHLRGTLRPLRAAFKSACASSLVGRVGPLVPGSHRHVPKRCTPLRLIFARADAEAPRAD